MDESKNIFNNPGIKTIYIPEQLMKSKKTRTKKKSENEKQNDPNYIYNPVSGRYVLKTGAIGKKLLKELDQENSSLEEGEPKPKPKPKPRRSRDVKQYKINRLDGGGISLNLDDEPSEEPKYQINLLRYGDERSIQPRENIIEITESFKQDRNFDNLNSLKKRLKKRHKSRKTNSTMYVYTDGAVSNNRRGSKLSVGGIGVYFGKHDRRNISERFQEHPVTNQRAEIWAIVRALRTIIQDRLHLQSELKIILYTDSMVSMNIITKDWKAKTNLDLVKQAWCLLEKIPNLEIKHIRSHTNKTDVHSIGNAMADRLACDGKDCPLR